MTRSFLVLSKCSGDPFTIGWGGAKFSWEKALPTLCTAPPLSPQWPEARSEAAGAEPSAPRAPPAALWDQVAAAPSDSDPRSGVACTRGPARLPQLPWSSRGRRRGSRLGPARADHPPGSAPRPQAKPRSPQPPARWGVLVALGSTGPGPRRRREAEQRLRGRRGAKDFPGWQRAGTPAGRCAAGPRAAPRSGPAATVANRLGPPRPRHGRGRQSRVRRRRIGCGALFLEVPVYSPLGG